MTLKEARRIIENNIGLFNGELLEAINKAITLLPKDPEKPSASDRLNYYIAACNYNPFNGKKNRMVVVRRQSMIYKLYLEGFSNHEITVATGLNHSTITMAINTFANNLEYRDCLARKTWEELLKHIH